MRINKLIVCGVLAFVLTSCATSALQKKEGQTGFETYSSYIMRSNHFQFFLRDYTVWDALNYSLNDEYNLIAKRLYTVSLMPASRGLDSLFVLTDIPAKKKYSLEIKRYSSEHPDLWSAKLISSGKLYAEFIRNNVEDPYGMTISYNGKEYRMKSQKDISVVLDGDKVIAEIQKKMYFFTSDLEFKTDTSSEVLPLYLYVAAGTLFDAIHLDSTGRRYK